MERPPPSPSGLLRLLAAPAVVLVTGVLSAGAAALYVSQVIEAQQEARFRSDVEEAVEALRDRVGVYTAMLRAARALFESLREEPDAGTFARFVGSLEIDRHYPGIQGVGWAKALRPQDVPAHEQLMRTMNPDYRVWPPGDRNLYSAIVHLEPLDWRNQRAIGYDMFSEPTRREAMERARDEGDVAASGKVELVQEVAGEERQGGFLIYIPVYGREAASQAERRRLLLGWVYAPFRAADLFGRTFDPHGTSSLQVWVYDGTAESPDALLFASESGTERHTWTHVDRLEIAGRQWTIRYSANRAFASRTEQVLPWGVLASGLALAWLLFWITRGDALARARAERAALRASFVAEAGKVLSSSMDAEQTIAEVATLAARRITDGCLVAVLEPAGAVWFTGHRDAAVARRAASLLRGTAPADAAALGVPTVISTGEPLVRERLHTPARGGSEAAAELMRDLAARAALAVPLHARGQALGAIVLLSSARRARFSPEDVELAEDLARLVSSAIEASRLYRRAQEAVAARDEFLSIASHELKTPLTSLVLHTDSLRTAVRRGTVEQSAGKVELIRRSVDRLSRLVASLLDISRISSGRLDFEVEEVDLADVAREVVARFDEEAVRAGCTLLLQAEPVRGRWDRMRLDQVLTNLLSNAVKYGPGKPVVVRVEADGDRGILSVRDHGIGISDEDQRRIFQRFERAVSKRNYGGFGLGLWIVRQIVEGLGGTVRVESTPGAGSVFTVELARGLHAPASASGPARPSAHSP